MFRKPSCVLSLGIASLILLLTVGILATQAARAQFSGEALYDTTGNQEGPPQGLSSDAWSAIRRQISESEYQVTPGNETSATWWTPNRNQGFQVEFTTEGVHFSARRGSDSPWSWSSRLVAWGRGNVLEPVPSAEIVAEANRLEYRRGPLVEWYVNDARGLEQGFTLSEPPAGSGEIVLELELAGTLRPELAQDGRSLVLRDGARTLRYAGLVAFDATGRHLEARLALSSKRLAIRVDDRSAVYPVTIDPVISQVSKLTADDAATGADFGVSVAISGNTVVVGARLSDNGLGSAYIFKRDAGGEYNWGSIKKLTANFAEAFGLSVAISGDTVIVGAPFTQSFSGTAYVFERNAGGMENWGLVRELTASIPAGGESFGGSVAISGNTVIVGAGGSAYVFERDAGGPDNWGQVQKLTAGNGFGVPVAISGDTAIVGEGNTNSAYVFERDIGGTGNWEQVKNLTAGGAFGSSVAISGNTILVGALATDSYTGATYVFERDAGGADQWGQVEILTATDATEGDRFGGSVAINGDTALVGATLTDDDGRSDSGSAYVFERTAGGATTWQQVHKFTADNAADGDTFGNSVALSGSTVLVGARSGNASGIEDSGAAYVFRLPTETVDLAVSTTESIDPVVSGSGVGNLTYTITVTNNGFVDVTGVVLSEDLTLPRGVTVHEVNAPTSTTFTTTSAPDGNWIVGDLAVEEHKTLEVSLNVSTLAAAGIDVVSSTATVTAVNETDTFSGNDSATVTTSIETAFIGQVRKLTAGDGAADDDFGHSVAISGDTVVVGARFDDGTGSAYVFERSFGGLDNWGMVQKLTCTDVAAGDLFGHSVAISGDTIVVGTTSGSAYVFERNFGAVENWGLVKELTGNNNFGVAVGISGDTIVVGASSADTAFVFERDSGGMENWGQVRQLTPPSVNRRFGASVAIRGDRVVVGATSDVGAAYVFERNFEGADNWGRVVELTAGDGAAGDEFGISVGIGGDRVVVGANLNDTHSGSTYVFERDFGGADNWGQVRKLTAADAAGGDTFGSGVVISGDTVVVGAPGDDNQSGSAYVFQRNSMGPDSWGQVSKLRAGDADDDDLFGGSVGISGNTVVISARMDDEMGGNSGAVYVFDLGADIAVSVEESNDLVVAGSGVGNLTYTVTLTNNGPQDAGGVVVDQDLTLPEGVEVAPPTGSGSTTFITTAAPDGAWMVDSLPAGSTETLTLELTVGASALAGVDVISHTATLTAINQSDIVSDNNQATERTSISQVADLGVTTSDVVLSAIPGESLSYTIIASNGGPSGDLAAELVDIFPADLECTYTSVPAGGAMGNTSTETTGANHLTETLSLPAGSSVTYTVECAIDSAATGMLSNTATIETSVIDPAPGNDSATDETDFTPQADLSVNVTDSVTSATSGDSLTYTINAANAGPSDEPAATLTDTFPADLTCSYTSQPSGGLTGNTEGSGNLGETLLMPAGSSVHYTVECTIDITATGTLSNTATITASVPDPTPGNNSSTDDNTSLTAVTWTEAGRLLTIRDHHTATLLPSDKVLVAGGTDGTASLSSAELYDPNTGTWTATGSLGARRQKHTATLLPSGKVLVSGGQDGDTSLSSAELYDPSTGTWEATDDLGTARRNHTATLLPSGQVLVAGGEGSGGALWSAELFDPDPGRETWTSADPLGEARSGHTATLLPSGKVLVAGGQSDDVTYLSSAELYDPSAGSWSPAASLQQARSFHTATLLASGNVLVAGGRSDDVTYLSSAELYEPSTGVGTWNFTASLQQARSFHTATLLASGKVLVVGGESATDSFLLRTEIYDPDPGMETWTRARPLGEARSSHTSTLLASGEVLATGGRGANGALWNTEIFDPSAAASTATGPLGGPRQEHTATLLPSLQVLVVGGDGGAGSLSSAELYDPSTGTWTPSVDPPAARKGHTATLLLSGEILVVGGQTGGVSLASEELYDPSTETWASTGALNTPRHDHTATLLASGKVLVAGGDDGSGNALPDVELYEPSTKVWTDAGALAIPRRNHTATLLPSGQVLVVGCDSATSRWCAELYDPKTETSTVYDSLATPRAHHTATLLPSGQVLVAGGRFLSADALPDAELYDPSTGTWEATGSLVTARSGHTATLLPSGKVLVAGGVTGGEVLNSAEIYEPITGTWTAMNPLAAPRSLHTATLLASGKVLVAGGDNVGGGGSGSSAELYDAATLSSSRLPVIDQASTAVSYADTSLDISGSFRGDSEAGGGGTNGSAVNYPLLHLRSLDGSEHHWLIPDLQANFWDEPRTLTVSRLPDTINPGPHLLSVIVAGVPSEGVPVEMTCSVGVNPALTVEPAGSVAVGETVTLTVDHSGGRLFHWQQCHGDQVTCREDDQGTPDDNEDGPGWDQIDGASGSAYTRTISGPDAGTRLRVKVESSCGAEATTDAAVLMIDDQVPPGCADAACTTLADPPVAVVTPNGGELWPLSQPGEPANVESISWTMSDDVRICEVRLDLLFSNDGGLSYPDENRTQLASFGSGGTCHNPGVETTSFDYTIPETPPSGVAGSLYKIEVTVTDHAGNTTTDESDKPFFTFKPDNDSVKTLILWHPDRMEALGLATDGLDDALQNLVAHPRVQGRIVDLGLADGLQDLYDDWDLGNIEANDVLFGPGGAHGYLNDEWLSIFTGVEYLILVGDDRVIPMARLSDGTAAATVVVSEKAYPDDPVTGGNGDLTPDGTRAGEALAANRYLSDDPLATLGTLTPNDLDNEVFLPDLGVGRLVETPGEIIASIATFISQEGALDLTQRPNNKVLVSAYDFLVDAGTKIRNRWENALGTGVEAGTLIGQNWTSTDLEGNLCPASDPYGVLSLNGHATHYEVGNPIAGGPFTIEGLDTNNLAGCDLSGSVVYAVGCHSGLPVADSGSAADNVQDLPQTMLGSGAMVFLGNTGYGWGLRHGVGYSERLVEIFSEELTAGNTVVLGDAVKRTKLRYFLESSRFDAYDEKVSMQWTLYGFPMYALRTGAAARSPARRLFDGPPPRLEDLPGRESFGPVTVHRQPRQRTLSDGVLLTPPPSLTRLDLTFDFSAEDVYKKFNAAGLEVPSQASADYCDATKADPDTNDDVPQGCYYTLNNVSSGQDLHTGATDRPLQPVFLYDSRLSGTSFHGFLWKGGTYVEEINWAPLVATLQSNVDGGFEDRASLPRVSKSRGRGRARKGATGGACEAADTEISSLVLEAGELLSDGEAVSPTFTERHYETVDVELLYFNSTVDPDANCDRTGPEISPSYQVTGSMIHWDVEASDPAGVWRVLVVWNDGTVESGVDGKARGRWQSLELEQVDGTWQGSLQVVGSSRLSYFVQAVDNRGNVSLPLAPEASLPPSGVPLDFPEIVEVNLAASEADLAVAVTATPNPVAGLQPFAATVSVTNLGPEPAAGVTVSAALPGATGAVGTGSGWSCETTAETVSCTRDVAELGTVPPITVFATAPPAGDVPVTVTASTLSHDAVAANDSANVSLSVLAAPQADLVLTQDVSFAADSWSPIYTLTITNDGPDAVSGATVTDIVSGELADVGWSCTASPGAACTTFGAGDVVDWVTIPAGGWVRYTVSTVLAPGFAGQLTNTATVTVPSGVYDPALGSNSSTVTIDYSGSIFTDGFESGDVTMWSSVVVGVP